MPRTPDSLSSRSRGKDGSHAETTSSMTPARVRTAHSPGEYSVRGTIRAYERRVSSVTSAPPIEYRAKPSPSSVSVTVIASNVRTRPAAVAIRWKTSGRSSVSPATRAISERTGTRSGGRPAAAMGASF